MAIVCKLKFLLHPTLSNIDTGSFDALFFKLAGLKSFQAANPLSFVWASILLQFVFAIVLNTAMINQRLFPQKNILIGLAYILITSFFAEFNFISSAFIANFFLLMAFVNILKLSGTSKPRQLCFNTGMLMGLASFFYFPAILLFVVFLFFIWLLRPFVLQEAITYLLGFIICYYVATAYLFLTDQLFQGRWQLNFHVSLPAPVGSTVHLIIFGIVSLLLLTRSAMVSSNNVRKEPMIVRKKWRLVYAYLFFATLISLFSSKFPSAFLVVALTPFSILLSQSFNQNKEKWNIFTFFFILISILGIHWIKI